MLKHRYSFTYLVIVCKNGIKLFRGQLDTLQTQSWIRLTGVWYGERKTETFKMNVQTMLVIADEEYFTYAINAIQNTKTLFLHHSCPLPGSWARNSPVLAEACGREGFLLLDTKVVNYSDLGRRERTSAGSAFQHLSREQKEKGNAYYLAISDRPNFPSPFRSNIRSYKVKAAYR